MLLPGQNGEDMIVTETPSSFCESENVGETPHKHGLNLSSSTDMSKSIVDDTTHQ